MQHCVVWDLLVLLELLDTIKNTLETQRMGKSSKVGRLCMSEAAEPAPKRW